MLSKTNRYFWDRNKTKFNNKVLPNNFRLLIIGSSGCGKNVLLLKMLLTPGFLDYDSLIIYSTTIQQFELQLLQQAFDQGLSKESIIFMFEHQELINTNQTAEYYTSPQEVINFFLEKKHITKSFNIGAKGYIQITLSSKPTDIISCDKLPKNKKNLVIFDDLVNNKNQSIQKSYFTRGRHNNCNVIYISQTYYELDKNSIRNNTNCFIFFKLNKTDRDNVYHDLFSNIFPDKADYDYEVQSHWKEKYNYFYLDREREELMEDIFDESSLE